MSRLNRLMGRIKRPYEGKSYICRMQSAAGTSYQPCDLVDINKGGFSLKCSSCPFDSPEVLKEFEEELCLGLQH